MKPARTLTAAQLDARLATLSERSGEINWLLIEAGRGTDRPSDIRGRTDPLSLRWIECAEQCAEAHHERARRLTYSGTLKPIREAV